MTSGTSYDNFRVGFPLDGSNWVMLYYKKKLHSLNIFFCFCFRVSDVFLLGKLCQFSKVSFSSSSSSFSAISSWILLNCKSFVLYQFRTPFNVNVCVCRDMFVSRHAFRLYKDFLLGFLLSLRHLKNKLEIKRKTIVTMFFFFSPSIVSFFFGRVVFCLLQIMKNHTLSLSYSLRMRFLVSTMSRYMNNV